ncbi:BolA family protein [Parasulfitobacter algicola]|uniref:BolA family transcriptional regulator n=1 Tax=Parasulfitobacter algicola TaxID=2614809 RepID=A0ABX2IQJ3_9RHOB|nr:BolA family protein [Sulfitobacter algicola]NSX55142.1 BolA family transcriptional regulator [Sulfitobacter algicola]
MSVTDEIKSRLEASFRPKELKIVDESESHRGHSGFQEGGESHFHVRIVSDSFNDMSRLQRHRAVHSAIGQDIISRIHALALDIN